MKQHANSILSTSPVPTSRCLPLPWVAAILVALPGLGCYRATGIQRPDVVSEEISEVGGDRVQGLKAQGAPSDFYLGNDYLELAVDGTPFGERPGVAGAPGGGSIIDAGKIALDQNYKRVSLPTDTLDRLTPVLNQDPDISLVFDQFKPINSDSEGRIEMTGYVHDPKGKLGVPVDSLGRVTGVSVTHVVSLQKADQFFLLQTTVKNNTSLVLPIRNIGDFLSQEISGGFRFNVPASEDMNDKALSDWGMEIPSPSLAKTGVGTTFGDLSLAVKAPMVAFMGVEPMGTTEDGHSTLGLLPMDTDRLVVTSDSQKVLDQLRPIFPQRLIAGGLPVANLAAGASMTHTRRLYLTGGTSSSGSIANQASGLFNLMNYDRFTRQSVDRGGFVFQPAGTAVRQGPYPSQFRIERNVGGIWKLERLEWMEPFENTTTSTSYYYPQLSLILPVGTYRLTVENALGSKVFNNLVNTNTNTNTANPDLPVPVVVPKYSTTENTYFTSSAADYICPEHDSVVSPLGSVIADKVTSHSFATRQLDGTANSIQPARIMVFGQNVADPSIKRTRILSSSFSSVYRTCVPVDSNYGVYGFLAGNQVFAASLPSRSPMSFWLAPGSYLAYAIRGPLSQLDSQPLEAFDGQTLTSHVFTAETMALPSGWTNFDLPGPSLATSGAILPVEKLSSALAEGVQVVGMTEKDRLMDGVGVATNFRNEFQVSTIVDADRTVIGSDPFVIEARSSDLGAYGFATALFTPTPRNERNGGARDPKTWTLADFLVQAEGQYTVIHRPRGPQGLFTQKQFDPTVKLGQGANAWWSTSSFLAGGKTQGAFDALELLRGESSDANGQPLSLQVADNATAWFTEFKAVRADWFSLLKQQTPTFFTKGLGLSSARFSLDTPVGLARTYLKATGFTQADMSPVLKALQSGAAVASTGPLLDVTLTAAGGTVAVGPGGLVSTSTPIASVTLTVNLWAPEWVPVNELRVTINGSTQILDITQLKPLATTDAAYDKRLTRGTYTLTLPTDKDAWVLVEAGVPLSTTGAYQAGTPWNLLMKGIYPIAITNPIFVDTTGGGYMAPGL